MKTTQSSQSKRNGFALVITVSLMIILTVLAVGMLSLATISLRSASTVENMAEARANARLALKIAIGELQKEMGPDKRISARAEILDKYPDTLALEGVANPNYLGVWNSWDTWLTDRKGSLSIQDTYKTTYPRGREQDPTNPKLFRRWLVSGLDADNFTTALNSTPTVQICGPGSAGTNVANHVKVNPVSVLKNGKVTGNYAWWIADESQKARLDLPEREDSSAVQAAQVVSSQTGRLGIERMTDMADFDTTPESLAQMITTRQAGISAKMATERFHDLTAHSLGLFTDVRSGGFKRDLNLAFESDTVPAEMDSVSLFGKSFDAPIRPMTGAIASITPQNPFIGPMSWRQMREFYRTYRSGFADSNIRQPVTWANGEPSTNRFLIGKDNFYQWDTMGYARQPVMLRQSWIIATSTQADSQVRDGTGYFILAVPVITLWNPYNVSLKMEATEMGVTGSLYAAMNLRQRIYRSGVLVAETDFPDELARPTYYTFSNNPNGNIAANQIGFRMVIAGVGNSPIIFKPGEVRIFSTDNRIANSAGANTNDRFFSSVPGFTQVENTTANVLRGLAYRVYPGVGPDNPQLALGFVINPFKDNTNPPPDMRSPPGSTISLLAGARSAPVIWSFQESPVNNGKTLRENGSTMDASFINSKESYWRTAYTGFTSLNWIDQGDIPNNGWIIPDTPSTRALWPGVGQSPLPVGIVSIVAKSPQRLMYDSAVSGNFTKDFGNRGWLHAPATRLNNFILDASDLSRADSPYQLHFTRVSGNSVSQLLEANGPLSYFGGGYTSTSGQSYVTALALPTSPIMNLGSFSGIRMEHGKSRDGVPGSGRPLWESYAKHKVTASAAGAFGLGIGNAYAHSMIAPTAVYTRNNMGTDDKATYFQRTTGTWVGTGLNLCDDYWDHLFLANEELWDSWFCSGIAPVLNAGSVVTTKRKVAEDFFSDNPTQMSPYFKPDVRGKTPQELANLAENTSASPGWNTIASYILNRGQFNVNSTSKEAWKALLMSLANRPISKYDNSAAPTVIPPTPGEVTLSRHLLTNGGEAQTGPSDDNAWNGFRKLTAPQIDKLAEEIVRQVKRRGPFLNMSEFINRRLTDDVEGVTGPLQAAIDWDEFNAGYDGTISGAGESINKDYKGSGDMISKLPATYPNPKAARGSRYAGIPGYVMQSDILQGISSSLSVRGDTFLIRAYGESLTSDGKVAARAWCETIVQRSPEYVDGSDPADKLMRTPGQLPSVSASLTTANATYGRKFNVVSFRWLNPNEV